MLPNNSTAHNDTTPFFSFAAAGWLKLWYYGVGKCFQHRLDLSKFRFTGASAGALVAAALVLNVDFDAVAEYTFKVSHTCRHTLSGPFRLRDYLLECLQQFVPADGHLLANDRLFIAVTEVPSGKAHVVSQFSSRNELIYYLFASCLIPFLAGLPVPWYPENNTITSSSLSSTSSTSSTSTSTSSTSTSSSSSFFSSFSMSHFTPSPLYHPLRWLIDGGFRQMLPLFAGVDNFTCSAVGPAHLTPYRRIPARYCLYPPSEDVFRAIYQQGFDDAARWLFSASMPSIAGDPSLLVSQSPLPRRVHEVHGPSQIDLPRAPRALKCRSEALIDYRPRPAVRFAPRAQCAARVGPRKDLAFYAQQVLLTCLDLLLLCFSSVFLAPFVWYAHLVEATVTFCNSTLLALVAALLRAAGFTEVLKHRSMKRSWQQFHASFSSSEIKGSRFHWALRYLPVSSYVIARRSSQHLEEKSSIYRLLKRSIFPI